MLKRDGLCLSVCVCVFYSRWCDVLNAFWVEEDREDIFYKRKSVLQCNLYDHLPYDNILIIMPNEQ